MLSQQGHGIKIEISYHPHERLDYGERFHFAAGDGGDS
jgi:hypothetical protein